MNDNINNKSKKTNNTERVISKCNSCRILIREAEFAYIFDQGKKIEKPSWVKCEECYNQFQPEAEKYNSSVSSLWTWGSIVNFVLSIVVGGIILHLNEPWSDNIIRTIVFSLVFAACFVLCSLIIWIIRLIWRPYSMLEKLVYSVKEIEEEVTEENPQV